MLDGIKMIDAQLFFYLSYVRQLGLTSVSQVQHKVYNNKS